MKDALEYLAKKHKINVTAQTVRNWEARGRGGVCLKGRTPDALDAWVARFGKKAFGRGRPRKAA
ncbi:hypothetical protein M0R72_08820 [Candidatus Pacearchaeota archaeon]|jgi:hypothetical protein|nr:hypothetical protein [Candidatus Pacearchaeota archaeon]